ncbi:hypothetical protein N0V82_000852 [Gnomoniopsis sp. IMI 355080]|nr:hypothetical protein N0V82_000852 [Gnomoniopsis sp. IMI 355080]
MPPYFSQDFPTPALRTALEKFTFQHGIVTLIAVIATYSFGLVVYRLFFHPLAKVPGPKLNAITELPFLWQSAISGTFTHSIPDLHRKYGPVVRTAPNNVAVAAEHAWPEVYVHRKGRAEYVKVNMNEPGGELQIIQATTTEDHRRQRRHLAHAFSEAANMFMDQLTLRAKIGEAIDVEKWFNFVTFDIIGDLSFGDSFHCLDTSDYHPWVEMIFSGIRGGAAKRLKLHNPLLWPLVRACMPQLRKDTGSHVQHAYFATEKAKERMALGESPGGRRDFMTYMMRKNRDGVNPMSDAEIFANVPLLILAGSETTATTLSGFAFYLAQNIEAHRKVTEEVRNAFASEADINFQSAHRLRYLHACIEEALRIFPAVAELPHRRSPGDIIGGHWIPQGTTVTTYQWAAYRDPQHFIEPHSYIPERWLPASHPDHQSRFEGDNKAVFQPFSAGPRNCIGKNLAYAELKVIAARFLYRFDYQILPGQENWHKNMRTFIVWEKPPLMVKVTLRESS